MTSPRPRSAFWASTMALALVASLVGLSACSSSAPMMQPTQAMGPGGPTVANANRSAPSPDPRVGLRAGLFNAQEAVWNLRVLSKTPPPEAFLGETNSDLAFTGNYAVQGNYNGVMVWDITNPSAPVLVTEYVCPASQSDVSVYGSLMFVSGEGTGGRLDCGVQGVSDPVSMERLRGIRIFDISDIRHPKYISNVQTCRGSHTHSVLKDPNDDDNVYVYISGSAGVRPEGELPGCSDGAPGDDPTTALFRIEVIKVPLAHPEQAAIVSSPRIFDGLVAPPRHGASPADLLQIDAARAAGKFILEIPGNTMVLPDRAATQMLAGIVTERGGSGDPTAADSAALRVALPAMIAARMGDRGAGDGVAAPGPDQCHDITLYPGIGLAGGACEGYGLLLDIRDPANPTRIEAVADSNFSYWHSATFNNDGSKVLFTDEWGGGGQPKCRADDPREWGANAIFAINNGELDFKSYYKLPAPQTAEENCVAHNGSLIPIPGRDVMVQAWYQGGISVFDWTDPNNTVEIAFHDRGPVDPNQMQMGGSWSVYWYNGRIVSSEIARGLDIFELTPSGWLTANEIAAANTVHLDYLNPQGQPTYVWPPSFALSRAYADQLERSGGMSASAVASVRTKLAAAEAASGSARSAALTAIASDVRGAMGSSSDQAKARMLASSLTQLASAM